MFKDKSYTWAVRFPDLPQPMTLGLEHLEDVQEYVEAIVEFSGETGGGAGVFVAPAHGTDGTQEVP